MKRQLLSLLNPPQLKRRDIWLTLLGAVLWIGATNLRPWVIQTRCVKDPSYCEPKTVHPWDRAALGKSSSQAEDFSNYAQILSGTWAYLVPISFHLGRAWITGGPFGLAVTLIGEDALLITQTLVLNGTLNETVRLIAQRPRPYVYSNPGYYGANTANYTSFYSGHTSFSSAANTALFLVLLSRSAPLWLLLLTGVGGQLITLFTAIFRVFAGRHFFSDVLVGALAGFLVAIWIALQHRPQSGPPSENHS